MGKQNYTDTYAKICDPENIRAAIHAAARGKRRKRSVRRALANEDATVERVRSILLEHRRYLPEVRIGREINDGIKAKKRIIVNPSFDEQIIDHALLQVIAPHFQKRFYNWSCGSVPGKGQEAMVAYMKRKVLSKPKSCKYYVKLDIKKCFDNLDVDAIYAEIARIERDPETLALIRYKLDSNAVFMPDGSVRKGGVPIGLYTSPWFVNIALTPFDHKVKDDCGVYMMVRFMDDILMVDGNRRKLEEAVDKGEERIGRFGFSWKSAPVVRKWAFGDIGKVRFCGIHISREGTEIRDTIFVRARKTVARIVGKMKRGRRVTWYDAARIISYGGRFLGFRAFSVFSKHVLRGRLKISRMRQKVSAHDKLISATAWRDKIIKEAHDAVQANRVERQAAVA